MRGHMRYVYPGRPGLVPLMMWWLGAVWLSLSSAGAADTANVSVTADTIELRIGDRPVLTYHKTVVSPPAGADPRFARSGFIHPLHAPGGGVVTSIHAPDHIHHYGLWHAWVHTRHRGRAIDFWNVKDGTGTVRYAETLRLIATGDHAGFVVRQEHVSLNDDGSEREVVLSEELEVTVREVDGAYWLDYVTRQTNVTDAPLELEAYRYGGTIGYRAPLDWDASNSNYLSSAGADRTNGHEARARWMAMYGPTDSGDATVAILGDPRNHDAPQRMRVWPDGRIFFVFVPIQETAWQIAAGATEKMRYRLVVSDGRPDMARLEAAWQILAEDDS